MLLDLIRRAAGLGKTHAAVAVNTGGEGRVTAVSSVTHEEIESQDGEPLPERTQMSVLQIPGHTLPVEPPE